MQFSFCPVCGQTLEQSDGIPLSCPTGHYRRAQAVGVAAVVTKGECFLLEQRAVTTGYGLWGLPGGMLEPNEEPEAGLAREVYEETGLTVSIGKFLSARGGRSVCILFYEAIPTGGTLKTSRESLDVRWVHARDLPLDKFAFLRHRELLQQYVQTFTA